MAKKGEKAGPRITVQWANVKKKVKGKTVNTVLASQVLESTAKLFGLKAAKNTVSTVKNITTKKGKKTVLIGGIRKVGSRKMFASTDGKIWHQLPVPFGLSLAKAYSIFKAGKKAYVIKFQGGTPKIIGVSSKDTKSKAARTTAAKPK